MTLKIKCPLCGNEAVKIRDRSEVYLINCSSCGDFQITRDCLDDLPTERKLLPQLMKVSAFTRYRTINKEPVATLFLGNPDSYSEGYSIQQVVDQFPSVPERKLKALQNLHGLSKYWGDAVSIERKDFAVFFPEVNEEQPSLMMIRALVEEGLVLGEVKLPTKLTVTEKGHLRLKSIVALEAPSVVHKEQVIQEPNQVAAQPSKLEGLHTRVLEVAQKLFGDKHFRSAVLDTYVALDNDVRRKSRLEQDGTALMQKAFTNKSPILKFVGGDDQQQGAMWLFSGAVMGIRNVLAHNQKESLEEQEALELLYFASTLFRKLDQTVNVEEENLMVTISQLSFQLDGVSSSSNSAKLRALFVTARQYDKGELYKLCFHKILELIYSGYFSDQNAGIKLLLEWNDIIMDHITTDDHIDLICSIYRAAGYMHPSKLAQELIREGFKPFTISLKLFQDHLLSSAEVFDNLLQRIWWNESFFKLSARYADTEFLSAFLNKVINKEIELEQPDLNWLSNALNREERKDIEELTDKIAKMREELSR
ncbi:TIGR02391 family protein [Paenibacillus xylanexedens]|uniref:TIGR02391 family protein n=1 Tax=Paenibacillus xylanexedens TaxID=528191 RepID=UPI003D01ED45